MCDCKKNSLDNLIQRAKKTATKKGFILKDNIKQLLLIANEVWEAFEYIMWDGDDVDKDLILILQDFCVNQASLKKIRNTKELEEYSEIRDREKFTEELADIVIRVFSYAGGNNLDLNKSILEKMEKNEKREKLHGNKF
jgi:NTP pyrophosphatase (non-canonical NTP hydrolase)